MNFRQSGTMRLASTALAVVLAAPAYAQAGAAPTGTTETASARTGLEDIVVTSRRTSEAQQTTPVAVTALTAETLLERQVVQVTDLARATPALSVGTGGTGPSTIVYLAIRGQAQNSPNSFSDAAIGIYIDGVYVARPIVGNLGFLDMASAEVLRGPQGTLFGRNTTGGALNLNTNQPSDEFEGYAKLGIGNYDQRLAETVINLPLTPDLAARVAFRYNERDGFVNNPIAGVRVQGIDSSIYARATVKWEPSNAPIVLTLSGDMMESEDTGNPTATVAINPRSPLAALYGAAQAGAPGFGAFITSTGADRLRPLSDFINPAFPGSTSKDGWLASYGNPATGNREIDVPRGYTNAYSGTANLVIDLDAVTIRSITGYRESDASSNLDLTGTPTRAGAFVSRYRQKQFSQEVQLSGDVGDFSWVAGGNYFRETGNEYSNSATFYLPPGGTFNRAFGSFVSSSFGLFAQANYNVTDDLRLTGGIRYTWDKRQINRMGIVDWRDPDPVCAVGANIGKRASVAPCTDVNEASFSYPAWLASLDYKITPDIFVYLKTSGASMSGGFNSRAVPPPYNSFFEPEKVRDVEVGFKGDLLDNRLRVNIAAFHAWQKGVQRIINTTFVDNTGATRLTQFVTNAGDAKTYGVEVEGTLIPWEGMSIDGSVAYLNAKYAEGSRIEQQLVGGVLVNVDRSGEPITQAPKWTWSVGGTQEFEFSSGTLKLHADYSFIASRYFDFFTTGDPAQKQAVAIANEASRIRGYGLLNGQITFAMDKPGIELSVWGRNLTNQEWFTNVFNSYTGLGATVQYQGQPRTYGASVAFRW